MRLSFFQKERSQRVTARGARYQVTAQTRRAETRRQQPDARRSAERFHFAQPAGRPKVYPSGCSGSPDMRPRPRVSIGAVVRCSDCVRALRPTAAARPLTDRAVIIGRDQSHHEELPLRSLRTELSASSWSFHHRTYRMGPFRCCFMCISTYQTPKPHNPLFT